MKKTMKNTKNSTKERIIKVYDIKSHRSFAVRPSEVNITATRDNPGQLHIHDWASTTISRTPEGAGLLYISDNMWKKFNRGHRNEW